MIDFWSSDLGAITGEAKDAFAKSFPTIPNNTKAVAKINKFVSEEYNGYKSLVVAWQIVEGEFKGQVVNHKLKVFDNETKVRHRALNMFRLLYNLFNINPPQGAPTDIDLLPFIGKIAGILIRQTDPKDHEEGKTFNWIAEVHPNSGFQAETGTPLPAADLESALTRARKRQQDQQNEFSEDVPF